MSEEYISGTIQKYLDDLAAKKPTPGGGSIGAFAGALSAGLLSMVANFSVGKNLPAEEKIKKILRESESLRGKMSRLIDEDVRVYEQLSLAFKLPKNEEGRKEKIQEALKKAAAVPLEITELGARLVELNEELLPICNTHLVSDIGVSVSLAYSSVEIGALNVEINLVSITDEVFTESYRSKLSALTDKSLKIKNEIYPKVRGKIG